MAPYPPPPTTLPTTPAQTLVLQYPWVDKIVAIVCLVVAPPVVLLVWLILRYHRKARAVARAQAQAQPCHHGRDVDIRSRSPFRYTQYTRFIETHPRSEPPQSPGLADTTPPPAPSDNVSPLSLPGTARHTRMQSMSTESCTSQTSMVTLYRQSNVNFTPTTLDDPFTDFSAIHHEDDDGTEDDNGTEDHHGTAANPPTDIYAAYPSSDSGIGEMRPDSGYHVSVGESELYNGSATPSMVSLTPSLIALMHIAILSAEHMRTVDEENAIESWLATYAEWSVEWVAETGEDWEAAERSASEDGLERAEDDSVEAVDDADLYGAD